jgi:NADH-quinone oxidoreductase subunit M
VLVGVFQENRAYAAFAALGIVLGAWYMLWTFQRLMQGEVTHPENRSLPDVQGREWGLLLPLVILMFLIGLAPNLLLNRMDKSVSQMLKQAGAVSVTYLQDR